MPYADFRHRMPLRVRWAEVDRQGVVFNPHYLLYGDVCVTEYWRAIGMAYPDEFSAIGADLFVRTATVDYRSAAVYDDVLAICGRIARIGGSSLRFLVEIYRAEAFSSPLVVCELVYVNVDAERRTPQRIAGALRAKIRAFETKAPEEGDGAG